MDISRKFDDIDYFPNKNGRNMLFFSKKKDGK